MSFMIAELIRFFILQNLNFFSRCRFFVHQQLGKPSKIHVEKKNRDSRLSKSNLYSFSNNKMIVDDGSVTRDEVELVMANLGIFCRPDEGEKLPEVLSSTELFDVFEEQQPDLNEVKGAFDVFDENRDGFIDASELQRVLCALGMKERAELEDCKMMIGAFDENADGRIDFDEFVKFMESTCC